MELSPFPYHGPLAASQVHGRDDLVADLIERVSARRVTALIGPRRYGKTSVLARVAADLTEVATVVVDLYEITSMADLVVRFDAAMAEASAVFAAQAKTIAASIQLSIGVARIELSRPVRQRPDPAVRYTSLLEVLVGTARRVPTLLIVDEFSSIGRVDGAAGALRTALQYHYTAMGIVFAGSMPSVMRELFTNRPQPFYAQADLVEIGPLDAAAVTGILADGFASTGRDAGILPGLLLDFARGHPQCTMQVADACWRHTPPKGSVSDQEWAAGLQDVRTATANGMAQLFSHHQPSERDVLRIVAAGGSLFGTAAGLLNLGRGAAQHARDVLLADGDLIDTAHGLAVTDPLMADWIARTLPVP